MSVTWSVVNSTHRQGLWSSTCLTFVVPRTRTKLGQRAFSGPVAWNALPATIRNTTESKLFKRLLKSYFITPPLTSLPKLYWLCNTLLDDFILYISVHQVTIVIVILIVIVIVHLQNANAEFHKVVQRHYSGEVETFTLLYDKFIQDNVYQILSELARFCRRYNNKHLRCFFRLTV